MEVIVLDGPKSELLDVMEELNEALYLLRVELAKLAAKPPALQRALDDVVETFNQATEAAMRMPADV